MSWSTLPPAVREVAEEVCTAKELEALKLWDAGAGTRRLALMLRISRSAARDRLENATRKLAAACEERGIQV